MAAPHALWPCVALGDGAGVTTALHSFHWEYRKLKGFPKMKDHGSATCQSADGLDLEIRFEVTSGVEVRRLLRPFWWLFDRDLPM
eukprot:SAG25_NODE_579_length_6770_cov_59.668266_10_plen_85_part_00